MNTWKRYWKSGGLAAAGTILLLFAYGLYEILATRNGMPRGERIAALPYAIPSLIAAALPVSAFVGGFSSAPEVFWSQKTTRFGVQVVALSGFLLAILCLLILGYAGPYSQTLSGDSELYLHELPAAWRTALAHGASQLRDPMRWYDAGRVGWDLFFRLFWSLLAGLMAGVGLLSGYWARWTSNRRVIAIQAWTIGLVLAVSVIFGVVVGEQLAERSGASLLGAWMLVRVPLLMLLVLSWPTWLSLRAPRRDAPLPVGAAAA